MNELHIVYFDRYSIISILSLSFLFNFISFSKSLNYTTNYIANKLQNKSLN